MHGQEILIVAEYLRLKQFKYAFRCFILGCDSSDVLLAHSTLQVSQAVTVDYPDLKLTAGLEIIAGLLYVPLSTGGRDFIAFLRKGQPRQVNWAGRPQKSSESQNVLEPRASFKIWSETVAGRCRAWTDEHLETAGVLALVYGKVGLDVVGWAMMWLMRWSSSLRCGGRRRPRCKLRSSRTSYSRTLVTKVWYSVARRCDRHAHLRDSAHSTQPHHQVSSICTYALSCT